MTSLNEVVGTIQSAHKTLFILCGLPYSGKTYVARQLREETGIGYVSIDDIFHARGYSWDESRLPDAEAWNEIFEESYEQMRAYLMRSENVLYDSTNHTRASRDKLRAVVTQEDGNAVVIHVEASADTVWERWEATQRDKHRPVVRADLVEATIVAYEPPMDDESPLRIRN